MMPEALRQTRNRLGLTQERMADVLGVSFVSVNRWEGGHSMPQRAVLDLYLAIAAALDRGFNGEQLARLAVQERSLFLRDLFAAAYAGVRK